MCVRPGAAAAAATAAAAGEGVQLQLTATWLDAARDLLTQQLSLRVARSAWSGSIALQPATP